LVGLGWGTPAPKGVGFFFSPTILQANQSIQPNMKLFTLLCFLILLGAVSTAPLPERVRAQIIPVRESKRAARKRRARATGQLYR
jgi:hypothetical protein